MAKNIFTEKQYNMENNVLPGSLSDDKLRKKLQTLLHPNSGKLYQKLQNGYIRVQAETNRIAFYSQKGLDFKLVSFISITSLVDMFAKTDAEVLFALSIPAHKDAVLQFIYNYVNSDQCPGVYMQGNDIMLGVAGGYASSSPAGGYKSPAMDVAYMATSAYMMGYINFHIHPNKGSHLLYHLLQSGQAEYLRVEVAETSVHFWTHKTGKNDNNVVTLTFEFVNKVNPDAEGLYKALCTQNERSQLLEAIKDYVNSVECPGVYMAANRIYLDKGVSVKPAEPAKPVDPIKPVESVKPVEPVKSEEPVKTQEKPEHPDMYESMTSHGLWRQLYESFGEGSSFETMVKTVPATCFVVADREVLRVTVMFENDEHVEMVGNGGTTVLEFPYKDMTQKQFMAQLNEGKTVTSEDMLHNFDVLEYEEDKAELVDYLMYYMDAIPFIIVEGNSFRSRRPGEEIIEVEHSLTAKVMSHKVVQLFGLDGEIVDILRRPNIDYCLIAAYKEYLKFIFVDTDDETIHTITYDYTDLVDEDFLEGEGCFSRLTCNYETDSLEEYLGRAVCAAPYFKPCMTSGGEMYCQIYLNKDVVPGLDEPFVPAKSEEPEVTETPDFSETPEDPEKPAAKADHPDMYQSLTAQGLWVEFVDSFGEESPFAVSKAPATCFVSAKEEFLEIALMVEDEEIADKTGLGAANFALVYSQADVKGMQALMEGGTVITADSFVNSFDHLLDEADQHALVDYMMGRISAMPHLIVEGNSFRTRREDEGHVDVPNTLTAKIMSQKVNKLFEPGGEYAELMRCSNVDFCQIAAYKDYVKFIFVEKESDNILKSFYWTFEGLAGEDFISGEGCFNQLLSGNEQLVLGSYLGERLLKKYPYFKPWEDEKHYYNDMLQLNTDVLSALDEPYMPDEPLEMDGPVGGPEIPDEPEVPDEPEIPDGPINYGGGMPLPPDEPEAPIYTVQSSPTTWAMVQYLNVQFGPGGALARFVKDSGFDGVDLRAGRNELAVHFWKRNRPSIERIGLTAMLMQYVQFNKGLEGEYECFLSDEEMDELENIIKNTVPYFK